MDHVFWIVCARTPIDGVAGSVETTCGYEGYESGYHVFTLTIYKLIFVCIYNGYIYIRMIFYDHIAPQNYPLALVQIYI